MTQTICNGVSKKVLLGFQNGAISERMLVKQYERNLKEANEFSSFGYNMRDLSVAERETHNPLLKQRIKQAIQEYQQKQIKSNIQNKLSVEKLYHFKKLALGIGLRKVISKMKLYCKRTNDTEATLVLLLLELEFANLSAKVNTYSKQERERIYERKDILLHKIQPLLHELGWRYGLNDAKGKNASYIVYVYLPNNVQVSWHSKDYFLYKYFPMIDAEWDGQVCMTMEKILTYIQEKYLKNNFPD